MVDITATYDLGIDLGTTYTCAAIVRDGRVEVCQLGSSSALVPSIVSIREDGTAIVGDAAERRLVTDPTRTVREFKRRIGDDSPYIIGGTPYTAAQLSGFILTDIVTRVTDQEGSAPRRVALTHPAEYGAHKLDQVRAAAAQAGVAAPVLIPEPVAAALAYMERASVPVGGHVLVYDFGGGTFDAAMVRRDADGPTLVGAVGGLERLGGVDLDEAVFHFVDQALGGQVGALDSGTPETRAAIARLRDESRAGKEALSADTDTHIPVLLPGAPPTVRLTREEFENFARQRVDETLPVLDRVVESADLTWADVTSILLVGGSSRVPLVAQRVAAHTGRPVATDTDPKATVAVGAALLASRLGGGAPPVPVPPPPAGVVVAGDGSDDATEEADAVTAQVIAADTDDGDEQNGSSRRWLVALLVLLLVLGGAGAVFALVGGGGDDDDDVAAGDSTSTTTGDSSTTSSTGDPNTTTVPVTGTTVPATTPPRTNAPPPPTTPATTAPTATTTTTTTGDPFVTHISPDQFLTCEEAEERGFLATVEWTTTGAVSVDVAIDGPGAFETGLPPNGSINNIPAQCGDTQVIRVTAVAANGERSAAEITLIEIEAEVT